MRLWGQTAWTGDVQVQTLELVLFEILLWDVIVVKTKHGFLQAVHIFYLRADGTRDTRAVSMRTKD